MFLTDPMMRAVIGQPRSSFNFRWMIDNKKILLCNVSKGLIGDDFESILSQTRKYAFPMSLTVQNTESLPSEALSAIFTNLGGRANPANEGQVVKTGQRGMHSGH